MRTLATTGSKTCTDAASPSPTACGTAGNGYAFLVLHQRTQDPRWLQRARAFAMHAIAQAEAEAAAVGRLRHSLWTGDQGLAIYLWDCIRAQPSFPTLDAFFAKEQHTEHGLRGVDRY